MSISSDKNSKLACASAGGSLGLAAIAGACSAGCGIAGAPIAGLLASIGLGSVATFLPILRIPLILIAIALGIYAMWSFIRKKNMVGVAVCGCVLGIGGSFLGWQMMAAKECKSGRTMTEIMQNLSPETKLVFQKGVYSLWPELGRAPTIEEVQKKLGFNSKERVLSAFSELGRIEEIFYPGTTTIKWLWPLSSIDHGVIVTLEGSKPVYARCAIDALGVSEMFGKRAKVMIHSPLDNKQIEMEISGKTLVKADPSVVVSHSDSCDDMLFLASRDEFDRYVQKTGKNYLKLFSLQDALKRGIHSFGGALKV